MKTEKITSLDFLQSLVRQAGDLLCASFGQNYRVFRKGEIDLVTEVDHASEALLIGEVKRR